MAYSDSEHVRLEAENARLRAALAEIAEFVAYDRVGIVDQLTVALADLSWVALRSKRALRVE